MAAFSRAVSVRRGFAPAARFRTQNLKYFSTNIRNFGFGETTFRKKRDVIMVALGRCFYMPNLVCKLTRARTQNLKYFVDKSRPDDPSRSPQRRRVAMPNSGCELWCAMWLCYQNFSSIRSRSEKSIETLASPHKPHWPAA